MTLERSKEPIMTSQFPSSKRISTGYPTSGIEQRSEIEAVPVQQ